jgi:hypothetical protein
VSAASKQPFSATASRTVDHKKPTGTVFAEKDRVVCQEGLDEAGLRWCGRNACGFYLLCAAMNLARMASLRAA